MDIVVVDENDNIIGSKPRDTLDYSTDIYRVSALWVTNSKGEVLIAQRKHTKKHDPGKWSPAVAGTVESHETYESNMYKEAEEEIGLKGYIFELGPKQFVVHNKRFFVQWYFCTVDKEANEFVPQEDEVEQVKWIQKDELIKDVSLNPDKYVASMPAALKTLYPEN